MKRISAMNLLRALLTVALTVLPCINAFSSEVLSFRSIPSKLLPTNAVRVLFSDSEGYVWIPTYSGLVRTRTMVRFHLQDQTHGWERSMPRTSAAPTGGMYG